MNRIGFDLHGVLDTYSYFRAAAKRAFDSPNQDMIIVTGSLFTPAVQAVLKGYGLQFNEFYSITQHLLDKDPKLITWIDGNPYAEDELWNSSKAEICKINHIDILFDDSPVYGQYFKDIPTLYVEVQNGKWNESGRHS